MPLLQRRSSAIVLLLSLSCLSILAATDDPSWTSIPTRSPVRG
ncbi:MAG: hypothetical protein WDM96_00030 [Lacunisphaera sp.]